MRIVGENATVQKSELGFDANNNKLFMQSIELDSRVGIIYTPDETGAPNQSVVVSFIGTPNAASRTNPGSGKPFMFSNQKGLWTIRIDLNAALFQDVCLVRAPGVTGNPFTAKGDDQIVANPGVPPYVNSGANGICESENTDSAETLFSRSSPLPVVQIGDTIKSAALHTVSSIAVNDPIAQANYDNLLAPRAARIGDHRVVFYAQVDGGANQMIVRGEQLDSDQDGLYDHWETDGIDLDGTGSIDLDLPGMGADPFKRDVFLQIDWGMDRPRCRSTSAPSISPPRLVIRQLAQFYASAPALASGVQAGIQLHVDAGTGRDAAQQFFSRSMGVGPLHGGKTVSAPGKPADRYPLFRGCSGTVNLNGVNAVDFDSVKAANFWAFQRGARELAFLYIVSADFHHAFGPTADDDNAIHSSERRRRQISFCSRTQTTRHWASISSVATRSRSHPERGRGDSAGSRRADFPTAMERRLSSFRMPGPSFPTLRASTSSSTDRAARAKRANGMTAHFRREEISPSRSAVIRAGSRATISVGSPTSGRPWPTRSGIFRHSNTAAPTTTITRPSTSA